MTGPPDPLEELQRHQSILDDVADRVDQLIETIKALWRHLDGGNGVYQACYDAEQAALFVVRLREKDITSYITRALGGDADTFWKGLLAVGDSATEFEKALSALVREPSEHLGSVLDGLAATVRRQVETVRDRLLTIARNVAVDPALRQHVQEIAKIGAVELGARAYLDQAAEAAEAAQRAADTAEQAAENATVATGEAAVWGLGEFFHDYAESEGRIADRFRLATVALLVLLAAVACGLILALHDRPAVEMLVKLAATVPIAVLAGYLTRESGRHRAAARWSAQLAIKLRTLPAYTATLRAAEKAEYRRALGAEIFGTGAEAPAAEAAQPGLYDDLIGLLGRTADAATRVREALSAGGSAPPSRE